MGGSKLIVCPLELFNLIGAYQLSISMCAAYVWLVSESESLHEDVRQGRLSDDHREADREENNPPSNGVLMFFCIGLPNCYVC